MREFLRLNLFLIMFLGFYNLVWAAPQIIEIEETYPMSETESQAQVFEYALQKATKQALGKSSIYLQSITQVTNGELTTDEITSYAAGMIKHEIVSESKRRDSNGKLLLVLKVRFSIDAYAIQKKLDTAKQNGIQEEEIQESVDLQERLGKAISKIENLQKQLNQTHDQRVQQQLQEAIDQFQAAHWFASGYKYYSEKAYDKAIESFSKAIDLDPSYGYAYYNRAQAYIDKEQLDLAIVDYHKTIEVNPKLAQAYNNRGVAYADKGELDLALADYNQALQLNPKYAIAYCNRGVAYDDKGLYDLAIDDYNKALKLNSKYVEAYNNRGITYCNKEEYSLALADFEMVLKLDPQNKSAANNYNKILEKKSQKY